MMSDSLSLPNNAFTPVDIYCVAKGYHECTFQIEKYGMKGSSLKILNDRGKLSHLKCELVDRCGHSNDVSGNYLAQEISRKISC